MRRKNALFNIITTLIMQSIVIIYGFVAAKIIITTYGSNINGLVASITQFLGYITLLESGFGPVVKAALYKPISNKDKKTINSILKTSDSFFKKLSGIFLIYIIALAFIYPIFVNTSFSYLFSIILIFIISISKFAEYFFGITYKIYISAEQKDYVVSAIQIVSYALNLVAVVVLAKMNVPIHILKLATGLIFVIRPIFLNIYAKKKYKINLKDSDDKVKLSQKWDGLAQHIATVIHYNTDIVILTLFGRLTEVSIYSVYYSIVKGIRIIIQSLASGIDSIFGNMLAKNEIENLNKKFSMYECVYYTICSMCYTCAMFLIIPFVHVYTRGVTDANYINIGFGTLLVLSEYVESIKQPYNELVKAAGHFKQTRIGSWIEAGLNILISILLVNKFGLIGIAIGTLSATTVRTLEIIIYCNRNILKRSIIHSFKKILLIIIETIALLVIMKFTNTIEAINYFTWIIKALLSFGISCIVVLTTNMIIWKNEFKMFKKIILSIIKKKGGSK